MRTLLQIAKGNPSCLGDPDPETWFRTDRGSLRRAQMVCLGCPERLLCLEGALERQERYGVWGGVSMDGAV